MSFDAMAWAMRTKAPSSGAKLLLLALADLVRPPAMKAFASAATLAQMTQLDRKTILANLRKLEEARLIERIDETAGRGGAPVFVLLMGTPTSTETGTTSADALPNEPIPDFPGTGTAFPANQSRISQEPVPKTGHISSNEPVKPVLSQKKERAKARAIKAHQSRDQAVALLPDVSPELLDAWLAVREEKRVPPVTKYVVLGLKREAEKAGLSVPDAIEHCCIAQWRNFNAGWYAHRMGSGASLRLTSGDASLAETQRRLGFASAGAAERDYTEGVDHDGRLVAG